MNALLERAIAAHGGHEHWQRLDALDVTVDVAGPAFAFKRRDPRRRRMHARVRAHEPVVTFRDFGRPGRTARYDHGAVMLGGARRAADEARRSARSNRCWDDLDELYFDGYALWQYMTTPFALAGPGFEVCDGPEDGILRVRFPSRVPSHSREQTYHFDNASRLTRLDYTAEVIAPWARAAQVCSLHRALGGVIVPTRRRVHPRLHGGGLVRPVMLVAIDVHDVRAVPA